MVCLTGFKLEKSFLLLPVSHTEPKRKSPSQKQFFWNQHRLIRSSTKACVQVFHKKLSAFLSMAHCSTSASSKGRKDLRETNFGGLPQDTVSYTSKRYFLFNSLGINIFLSGVLPSLQISIYINREYLFVFRLQPFKLNAMHGSLLLRFF